ncbi:MAG TPA: DNA-binding protein [Planctomycetes bacterium]|nr:DNA-binding protein [Fuerstiella sp.]HIK92052.1 DNA-binding protein [Planctomycetota bacterium]
MAYAKNTAARLLLKPREAAERLSISERSLWANTTPRGPIPCIRIGGSVRYGTVALQAYIDSQQLASSDA